MTCTQDLERLLRTSVGVYRVCRVTWGGDGGDEGVSPWVVTSDFIQWGYSGVRLREDLGTKRGRWTGRLGLGPVRRVGPPTSLRVVSFVKVIARFRV